MFYKLKISYDLRIMKVVVDTIEWLYFTIKGSKMYSYPEYHQQTKMIFKKLLR